MFWLSGTHTYSAVLSVLWKSFLQPALIDHPTGGMNRYGLTKWAPAFLKNFPMQSDV